jgi:hypothetical protein
MIVKELIEFLQTCNAELPVVFPEGKLYTRLPSSGRLYYILDNAKVWTVQRWDYKDEEVVLLDTDKESCTVL